MLSVLRYDVNSMSVSWCVIPFAAVALGAGSVRLGEAHHLPAIGLQIALPANMTALPLDSLTDWVRVGVKGDQDRYAQILVLSALPEGTRRDAKTAASMWIRQAERQRTDYRVKAQRPVKWQDDGWEVLAGYRADDRDVTSLQWFGWRTGRPGLVYVLTYDVLEGRGDAMRLVLRAVAGSCKTTPIRPACTQPVRMGNRQFLPKHGLSLQVPESLRMLVPNRKNMLLRAGAVDYQRDRLLPVLALTTNETRSGETPQVRLERSVETLLPSLKPAGGKIQSRAPATVGDRQAHEVLLSLTQRRERLLTAIRLTLWRERALVLSLTYPAANARQLAEAMDKVAGSVQFQP